MDNKEPVTFERSQVLAEFVPSVEAGQSYTEASSEVQIAQPNQIMAK